jgi:hypothetical protein
VARCLDVVDWYRLLLVEYSWSREKQKTDWCRLLLKPTD